MLFFILIWNLMAAGCLGMGLGLLKLFYREHSLRRSDCLIIGMWLGVIIISLWLTVISFFVPLSLSVAISSILGLLLLVLLPQGNWQVFALLKPDLSPSRIAWILAVQFIISILLCRTLGWIDSAIYHLGLMKWLHEFGSVPGLALINERFGYTSVWFPFSAPLMADIFRDNIGATTNGFIFIVALWSSWLMSQEIFKASQYFSDYFGCAFLLLTTGYYGLEFWASTPSLVSFSPDITVTFLIGITSWIILRNQECSDHQFVSAPTKACKQIQGSLSIKHLGLVFAAGALSCKLTALPTILISLGSYSIKSHKFFMRRLVRGLVWLTVLLLPIMSFSVIVSGCPFYPLGAICFDLPWTLSLESSLNALRPILFLKGDTTFSGIPDLKNLIDFMLTRFEVIASRIQRIDSGTLLLGGIGIVLMFTGLYCAWKYLSWPSWTSLVWVVILALFGSSFILILSPMVRFGLGYFCLIPALVLAVVLKHISGEQLLMHVGLEHEQMSFLFMFAFGLSIIILGSQTERLNLFVPPPLPSEELIRAQVNDIEYVYPIDEQPTCWAADLPCAMTVIQDNIHLRIPTQGLRGGFRREKK